MTAPQGRPDIGTACNAVPVQCPGNTHTPPIHHATHSCHGRCTGGTQVYAWEVVSSLGTAMGGHSRASQQVLHGQHMGSPGWQPFSQSDCQAEELCRPEQGVSGQAGACLAPCCHMAQATWSMTVEGSAACISDCHTQACHMTVSLVTPASMLY